MTHNNIHDKVWACTSGVVNYRSMKFLDQLHEFYIATLPGVLSVNERPGLEAIVSGGQHRGGSTCMHESLQVQCICLDVIT